MCIRDRFITVEGEKKEVKDGLTLPELIAHEHVEMPEYVIVSSNEEFVASEDKESTVLKEAKEILEDVLGIAQRDEALLEYDGDVNFMKGARCV